MCIYCTNMTHPTLPNIVMKNYFLIIVTVLMIFSCNSSKHESDSIIASEICSEVNANGGTLWYTEDQSTKNKETKYYVELDVIGSEMIHKRNTDKDLVASYCASQLFKRLDPMTIEKNYGYNIIFDTENDIFTPKKYFYKNEELIQAWKAFNNIDQYLNYVTKDQFSKATSLIDTNFYSMKVDSLNQIIKSQIGPSILKTFHFYKHYQYESEDGSKKFSCFLISAVITKQDSTQIVLDFINPISELDNKLIFVRPRQ